MHQIVTKNTHENKILDVMITDLHQLYQIPVIVQPVQADDPTRGSPSDHSIPLALPVSRNTGVHNCKCETATRVRNTTIQ